MGACQVTRRRERSAQPLNSDLEHRPETILVTGKIRAGTKKLTKGVAGGGAVPLGAGFAVLGMDLSWVCRGGLLPID